MTRTLILLRHGKSAYPDGVADHERPLAPRGRREAGLAGRWLRAHQPPIDAVLCSTAVRTRKTLAEAAVEAPVDYRDDLYATSPGVLVEAIRAVDEHVTTLLVVGHEPSLSETALLLAPDHDSEIAHQITEKFPTSAVAVLAVRGPWHKLEAGRAELTGFHIPR
ncbi:MAG: histidine phosphatase family protein [Rhodococcus sp. (in: high G+C Gram-positive bacteria)]|uniref:SixA phosphatase family protein n=1 Tax=Rhodococcus sp. TaxID=1831 RepID=UPI003BB64C40